LKQALARRAGRAIINIFPFHLRGGRAEGDVERRMGVITWKLRRINIKGASGPGSRSLSYIVSYKYKPQIMIIIILLPLGVYILFYEI
jgi:hypothetical protein